jgi:hypothetical protein
MDFYSYDSTCCPSEGEFWFQHFFFFFFEIDIRMLYIIFWQSSWLLVMLLICQVLVKHLGEEKTHTHTHTHTCIYIYILISNVNSLITVRRKHIERHWSSIIMILLSLWFYLLRHTLKCREGSLFFVENLLE